MNNQTMKEYFLKIPRSTKIFVIFALIIGLGFVGAGVWFDGFGGLPREFVESKEQASLISDELLELSRDSGVNLESINALIGNGKYVEAAGLIKIEFDKNERIKEKAVTLSGDLAQMAKSSASISSDKKAQLALEAVSVQTELLSALLSYNDNLNELLGILEMQINGQEIDSRDVELLTGKINSLAQSVDGLDKKFDELIGALEDGSE